jgi:hypothetical protein
MILYSKEVKVIDLKTWERSVEDVVDGMHQAYYQGSREGEYLVTVILEKLGCDRMSEKGAKVALLNLCSKHSTSWHSGSYHFDFYTGTYQWGDKKLHVTSCEALYLYRRIILDESSSQERYYLRNMRKKFGGEFLQEVTK